MERNSGDKDKLPSQFSKSQTMDIFVHMWKGPIEQYYYYSDKFYTCKDDWENLKGNERNEELRA